MWFFKNNWKAKLRDQVDAILLQDIEIMLDDLVAIVGASGPHDIIVEMLKYIVSGDIKCRFVLYDKSGNIIKECSSIFEEQTWQTSDWRVVYSKA
jgi:hypothetical protein